MAKHCIHLICTIVSEIQELGSGVVKKPSSTMFNYLAKPLKHGPSKELENRKENDKTETKNAHSGKEKKKKKSGELTE